jgi:hypothetical protein
MVEILKLKLDILTPSSPTTTTCVCRERAAASLLLTSGLQTVFKRSNLERERFCPFFQGTRSNHFQASHFCACSPASGVYVEGLAFVGYQILGVHFKEKSSSGGQQW